MKLFYMYFLDFVSRSLVLRLSWGLNLGSIGYVILLAKKYSSVQKLTEEDFFLGSHTGELAKLFYLQKKQKIEKYIYRLNDENEKEQANKELVWLDHMIALHFSYLLAPLIKTVLIALKLVMN